VRSDGRRQIVNKCRQMGAWKFDKPGFGQPLAMRDLLVNVAEERGYGKALKEGDPWVWGDEVKTPPVIPDETVSSFEPVLGSTLLKGTSE
jgi:hypothetical protein